MVLAALTLNLSMACLRFFRPQENSYSPILATASLSLIKYTVIILFSTLYLFSRKPEWPKKNWGYGLLFGLSDPLATISLIVGGLAIPLALNSILGDLHILFTPLILFMFGARKKRSSQKLSYSILGFMGALCFAWPQIQSPNGYSTALILPLFASVLWCGCGILSGKVAEWPLALVQLITAAEGLFLSVILALNFGGVSGDLSDLSILWTNHSLLWSIVFSVVAQIFFIASLASGDILAALIAAPLYAVFGGLVGFIFFGELFGIFEWVGFILVLLSAALYQRSPTPVPESSPKVQV